MESFNGKLRYELLNREVFAALLEAKLLSEAGVRNAIRFAHIALRATDLPLLRLEYRRL